MSMDQLDFCMDTLVIDPATIINFLSVIIAVYYYNTNSRSYQLQDLV